MIAKASFSVCWKRRPRVWKRGERIEAMVIELTDKTSEDVKRKQEYPTMEKVGRSGAAWEGFC